MIVNNQIFIRENIVKTIRMYFDKENFHEVFPPLLNNAVPLEPYIYPFSTNWNTGMQTATFYLPVSPERQMIHYLAAEVGDCYTISPSFRNLENQGSVHSPEFIMVEWYRIDKKMQTVMDDLSQLIILCKHQLDRLQNKPKNNYLKYGNQSVDFTLPWPIISLEKLFQDICQLNYKRFIKDDDYAIKQVIKKGYQTKNARWEELFTQIFVNEIEPHIPHHPHFLIDFPSRTSPLCLVNPKKPYLAQRFELYIASVELANGSPENTDENSVRLAFIAEQKRRAKNGLFVPMLDEQFLADLHQLHLTGKDYPGVGLGLERLIMILSGEQTIKLV